LIIVYADFLDEVGIDRQEVFEIGALAAVRSLASWRVREVAEACLIHGLMQALQLGAHSSSQLPSAVRGLFKEVVSGLDYIAVVIRFPRAANSDGLLPPAEALL